MKIDLFKPSIIVANSVPLTASQLDLFNYMLKTAYEQLEKNILLTSFKFSVEELKKNCNPRLNSYSKIYDEIKEIYDKEFEFNVLGKDKKIEKHVKSRFIPAIIRNSDSTIEVALEPFTIGILKNMIAAKNKTQLPDGNVSEFEKRPYAKLAYAEHKDIKFYPAKVIYEIVKDYEGFPIPEITIEEFKKVTDTTDKYQKNYNKMVIDKIEQILNEKFNLDLKITPVKFGRVIKNLKIETRINASGEKEYTREEIQAEYFQYLSSGGLEEHWNHPKTVLTSFLKLKRYKLKSGE